MLFCMLSALLLQVPMFFFIPSQSRIEFRIFLDVVHSKNMCWNVSSFCLHSTHILSGMSPNLSLVKNFPWENIHNANLCFGGIPLFHIIGFHGHFSILFTKKSQALDTPFELLLLNQFCRQWMAASFVPLLATMVSRICSICFISGDCSLFHCQFHTLSCLLYCWVIHLIHRQSCLRCYLAHYCIQMELGMFYFSFFFSFLFFTLNTALLIVACDNILYT